MWHGWAVSAWSGLVGLHEARQGGLGPFGSVKLRCVEDGQVRRVKAVEVCCVLLRQGQAGLGKAVALRSVMIRLGTAWCGGHGNVCLVETSCVMAWSGGRGVSRWGGLASGEAVNFKRRSK